MMFHGLIYLCMYMHLTLKNIKTDIRTVHVCVYIYTHTHLSNRHTHGTLEVEPHFSKCGIPVKMYHGKAVSWYDIHTLDSREAYM